MKKTTIVLLTVVSLSTAAFSFGPSSHGHGPFAGEHKGGLYKLVKQLDLTSEQKDELSKLRDARKVAMQKNKIMYQDKKQELMKSIKPDISTFMTADSFDKEAFKEEMTKRSKERVNMMKQRIAGMIEKRVEGMEKVFTILTPEQRVKLIELSKEN